MQVVQVIAAAAFPTSTAKAEEHLERLRELRDNTIFKSLAALCQADVSQEEASRLSKVTGPLPDQDPPPCELHMRIHAPAGITLSHHWVRMALTGTRLPSQGSVTHEDILRSTAIISCCVPETYPYSVQDVVQRVGSKGPMGEFARALCAQLTPQLIAVQHLTELLKVAKEEEDPPDEAFLDAVLRLLADSALAAPRMTASLEPQVPRQQQTHIYGP